MRLVPVAVVCAFLWLPAFSAPPETPPPRVAVIRMREAIASTKQGKKEIADLAAMAAKHQAELKKEQAEIDALKTRLSDARTLLNSDAKEDLSREIDLKSGQFQRHVEDLQWEAQQREQKIYGDIGARMLKVIADYAKKNNFVLVMNVSDAATPIMWASAVVNITGRIVQQYDLAYPVEAKPAATKAP